jgi:hypothetical protein
MTGYQSKKLMAQSREDDLLRNAIENLISEGWDEEAVAVKEAADRIEQLEAVLSELVNATIADEEGECHERFYLAWKNVRDIFEGKVNDNRD